MPAFYTVYVGCLVLVALLGFGLAIYAVNHPEPVAATRPFVVLMLLVGWWALCATIAAVGPNAEWARFWGIPLRFIAVIYIPPALLVFSLITSEQEQWITRRRLVWLLLIPTISVLLILTSFAHNLFIYDVVYEQFGGYWLRTAWSKGAWFGIYSAYGYLLLLVSIVVLAMYARRARYPYRQQAWLTLLGALLPIIASIFSTFNLLPPPNLDLIVLGFFLMGIAFAIAIFSYQMLDIKPIARSLIVENMSDMVVVLDKNNNVVDVNSRVEAALGYGRRQIIGRPATEAFAPWVQFFQAFVDTEKANTVLTVPIKNKPVYLDLSITPLKRHGQLEGRLFVLRDVTHFKKTQYALQTALRNTEAVYAVAQSVSDFSRLTDILQIIVDTIAHSLPADRVALIGFDLERNAITHYVNGGPGADKVVQVPYRELMEGLSGWVVKEMKPALSPKAVPDPRENEQVQRRRLDSFCGAIIVVPLAYREQLLGTITAINRPDEPDFSEKDVDLMQAMANQGAIAIENARLYKAEQERVMELQETNQALNAFARTVAHDLKNPLGLIVGYAELIRIRDEEKKEVISEKTLQDLQMISRQGYKMSSIIDSLLMLASIRKKQDVQLTAVDMAEVVHEVLQRLTWQIEENRAQITLPEQWPVPLGFAPWIEETWANYIGNALKYGGTPPRIELGGEVLPNGEHCFWVRDNGAGLTSEQQTKLFKEFSRLAEHQDADGHGLGLSIVEYIVRRLGGRVGVESKPGAGSTFSFVLPAADIQMQEYNL